MKKNFYPVDTTSAFYQSTEIVFEPLKNITNRSGDGYRDELGVMESIWFDKKVLIFLKRPIYR